MQHEHLSTFLDVLETRNFKRTSERLGITQSSVSARIMKLEAVVGTKLFERGRQGAFPTASGLRFEQHARLIQASWDHARREVGIGPERDRLLRLAGQFSLMRSVLIDWIVEFKKTENRTSIDLQADYSSQIIRDLSIGILDVGLLFSPAYLPDLQIQLEGLEDFTMVSTEACALKDVSAKKYIHTGYTAHFDRKHHELLPQFASSPISVGYEELSVELLRRIGGTTYLPDKLAHSLCKQWRDITLVSDAPSISQPVYSAVHIRRIHDPAIVRVLDVLRKILSTKIP